VSRKDVEAFRALYREPLRRTRNRTIARGDRIRKRGVLFTSERARELGAIGNRKRWDGARQDDRRRAAMTASRARMKSMTAEERSEVSRRNSAVFWNSQNAEQRAERMARVRAGRVRVVRGLWPWPFPFGPAAPKVTRDEALERARKAAATLQGARDLAKRCAICGSRNGGALVHLRKLTPTNAKGRWVHVPCFHATKPKPGERRRPYVA
jgi:hypothetical protein